ncbi:hypothetical protein PPACK8108_LOCUS10752 [Phakopsora pachyrhizi]|uniref:Uncharacterized protein n=1 Tax=Phakopsora pachyrhizi TaxID=170000 RepID=A0AAV0B0Y3_PHAPC|nr:hypothetical protein PPACK8108_LOCUS10752 [Phakopsora pachyrhizi]
MMNNLETSELLYNSNRSSKNLIYSINGDTNPIFAESVTSQEDFSDDERVCNQGISHPNQKQLNQHLLRSKTMDHYQSDNNLSSSDSYFHLPVIGPDDSEDQGQDVLVEKIQLTDQDLTSPNMNDDLSCIKAGEDLQSRLTHSYPPQVPLQRILTQLAQLSSGVLSTGHSPPLPHISLL